MNGLSLESIDGTVIVASGCDLLPFVGHVAPFNGNVGVDDRGIEVDRGAMLLGDAPEGVGGRCGEASAEKMVRSEEHTSELQSRFDLVCRLLLEKKKYKNNE